MRCLNFHLDGSQIHMFLHQQTKSTHKFPFFLLFCCSWESQVEPVELMNITLEDNVDSIYLRATEKTHEVSSMEPTNTKVLPHVLSLELLLTKSEVSPAKFFFPRAPFKDLGQTFLHDF